MIIESVSNSKYKLINKLSSKKYRDKENLFIVESRKLVDEAINSSANIDFIFLRDGVDFPTSYETIVFSEKLFNKLSGFKNPDGIGAVVKKPTKREISSDRIVLLDRINDPGNMGTIIRSAEAFGFDDIILTRECVDIFNEKCLRASMGSVFRQNIIRVDLDYIKNLKESYSIISADMQGVDIRKFIPSDKLILAIGNEANGLSKEIRDITDHFVKIHMKGQIESLNAAIASSIIMNRFML